MDGSVTRRRLVQGIAVVAAAGLVVPAATGTVAAAPSPWLFLTEAEAAFLSAACDRIIPPDPPGPGAVEVGCVHFIDRQLGGAFGAGARLYQKGPFAEATEQQGYQLPYTPAELYRLAIAEIDRRTMPGFATLPAAAQDDLLQRLEAGAEEFGPWGGPFADLLVRNTREGYFADPIYGGNRGMAAWRMIGFPGAYAQYVELVDEHDAVFTRPPMSIAQSALHGAH